MYIGGDWVSTPDRQTIELDLPPMDSSSYGALATTVGLKILTHWHSDCSARELRLPHKSYNLECSEEVSSV